MSSGTSKCQWIRDQEETQTSWQTDPEQKAQFLRPGGTRVAAAPAVKVGTRWSGVSLEHEGRSWVISSTCLQARLWSQ